MRPVFSLTASPTCSTSDRSWQASSPGRSAPCTARALPRPSHRRAGSCASRSRARPATTGKSRTSSLLSGRLRCSSCSFHPFKFFHLFFCKDTRRRPLYPWVIVCLRPVLVATEIKQPFKQRHLTLFLQRNGSLNHCSNLQLLYL